MKTDFLYPFRVFHGKVHESIQRRKEKIILRKHYLKAYRIQKANKGKCVFLVLTPEHTNLGDHAIAFSEIQLLNKLGIGYVEITGKTLQEWKYKNMLGIMNKYPIMINGGGNLGTLWFDAEELMREVVEKNPLSPIIIMPNTIYYEDSNWGREEFERSKKLYNSHKNLTIYAREQVSFNKMNGQYNAVNLMPDMVLFLNKCSETKERKGCLVCLRKDREKTITKSDEAMLMNELKLLFGNDMKTTDTHTTENVSTDRREEELEKKFAEFRGAELVVTDRLHGMIFCAITGTPCIVINSRSPKVKGCYEWVKHNEHIRFCDNVSDVVRIYEDIPKKHNSYNNVNLKEYYQQLCDDVSKRF